MGQPGESKEQTLQVPLSATLRLPCAKATALPVIRYLYLNSLRQGRGRVNVPFWVFCSLEITSLK